MGRKRVKPTKVAVLTTDQLIGMDIRSLSLGLFLQNVNLRDKRIRVRVSWMVIRTREALYPGVPKPKQHLQYAQDCDVTEACQRMWEKGDILPNKTRLELMIKGKMIDLSHWRTFPVAQ